MNEKTKAFHDDIMRHKLTISDCSEQLKWRELNEVSRRFIKREIEQAQVKIRKLAAKINRLERPDKMPESGITDEMVEAARAYPIEELIDFSSFGRTEAFCHVSDSPSLAHLPDGNRAYCHVCSRVFNPIDVLIVRDGMTFVDAVKTLSKEI